MSEIIKGALVRLVEGGGCNAADGFTDGDICEVTNTNSGGRFAIAIKGVKHGVTGYVDTDQLEAIPATPTLDELTDPADLDWGALRSAADDRRDWREAWGIVGTDHTGDATPGEVYLLSVARHKSATAAALHHWRELRERVIPLGKGNLSWQRIKGIAAWESSARAQADEAAAHRERMRIRRTTTHGYTLTVDGQPVGVSTPHMVGGPFGRSATRAIIDDPADPDPELYGNGRGVVGVLNNPYLSAAAQRGEITGTLSIAAATRTIADVRAATRETSRQIDAMTRSLNPAPRGPQPRRRR